MLPEPQSAPINPAFRVLALIGLAFFLTVAVHFLPLFTTDQPGPAWTVHGAWASVTVLDDEAGAAAPSTPFGIALLAAGAILLAAFVLELRHRAAAKQATLAAAVFLVATVATIGFIAAGTGEGPATMAYGLWALVVAVALAVLAAVLVHREPRPGRD
ncbi:hypothetical protein M8542_20590 [Amycolatopsis sp. OK19-0408]|uniref:Transmembrane protein n=1 Tax=Amycolatopsis iheyensis TaxID=2945988 RepID=A0A9X2SM50_9PSEU|nr:hypothetical protein [Amycolatopsis iheyensis]MCR6485230.1 hypothetical protein [Amycolatopsis iheyensis]